MKTLRLIGTALVAVVLSAGFCACSDDDDDGGDSGLVGTTWKVTSDPDYEGMVVTFNNNHTITYSWNGYSNSNENTVFWSVDGDVLTININHDDCMEGWLVVEGNTATYTYHWYDYTGNWNETEYYTMTLKKQ